MVWKMSTTLCRDSKFSKVFQLLEPRPIHSSKCSSVIWWMRKFVVFLQKCLHTSLLVFICCVPEKVFAYKWYCIYVMMMIHQILVNKVSTALEYRCVSSDQWQVCPGGWEGQSSLHTMCDTIWYNINNKYSVQTSCCNKCIVDVVVGMFDIYLSIYIYMYNLKI